MKIQTPKRLRLTGPMIAMLKSIRDHGDAGFHIKGRSQAGGSGQTWHALQKAGYVVHDRGQDYLRPPGASALAQAIGAGNRPPCTCFIRWDTCARHGHKKDPGQCAEVDASSPPETEPEK